MSNQVTPTELRRQARMKRDLSKFAQGATRQEELAEALELERRAHELEQQAGQA